MNVIPIASKKKTRTSIPQSVRFNVFRRDNFTCRYCGRSSPDVVLHCDHAQSVKNGGNDDESNLVTSCVDCNLGKSSKSITAPSGALAGPLTVTASEQGRGLVGMWGHTFEDDHESTSGKMIKWQFTIIREITPGLYLCQLFSWLDGSPTICEVIPLFELIGECKLYASFELMDNAYLKECQQRRIRRGAENWDA